ncbi:MAG: response regulator [candidate division Zixibacteria bacterium]|nr:response regulator [Candidatus Tariuqbacter arcticus]
MQESFNRESETTDNSVRSDISLTRELLVNLLSAQTPDSILDYVIDAAFSISEVEGCGIYLIDNAYQMAVLHNHRGLADYLVENLVQLPLSLNIVEHIRETKNIVEFDSFIGDSGGETERKGIFSDYCLYFSPLVFRDEFNGILILNTSPENKLSISSIELIKTISTAAAGIMSKFETELILRNSEELNRGIVNSSPMGILFIDTDGVVVFENSAMSKIIGSDDNPQASLIGKKIQNISKRESEILHQSISELLSGKSIYGLEISYLDQAGKQLMLEFHGAPRRGNAGEVIGAVLMCLDQTMYRLMESQLQQAQKMEAIGTLAEGIAHDFNNLLTGIMGNVEFAIFRMKDSEDISENLESIFQSSKRAAELTSQLLAFGKKRLEHPKPIDLRISFKEAIQLIRRTKSPLINIKLTMNAEKHIINGDDGQINQMLMNLLINACDAMPEGGVINIRTENTSMISDNLEFKGEYESMEYIRLVISDTGTGIEKENLKRIFEPFYTTKEVGKGTGLGLAMVYGIVKSHQGLIEVESTVGAGTSFSLYFPLSHDTIESKEEKIELESKGGHETILLVDDEESVRQFGRMLLENFGYNVISASDGLEAVDIYRNMGDRIQLVILDLSMPRKSGRETLGDLLDFNPDIKVIVSSGFDKGGQVKTLLEMGAKSFVAKPYRLERMLDEVRKVLDE